MSYIVKNCPAILRMTKICDAYETTRDLPQFCKDCTDCVVKQITELCNDEKEQETDPLNSYGISLAQKILDLFDIEEIRE